MSDSPIRLGIFGGSFDPPHLGHMIIAQTILEELALDKILFVPAAIPPHKTNKRHTSAEFRLKLVEAATADNAAFEVSSIEVQKGGLSYSCDTIESIQKIYSESNLKIFLIIGEDNAETFHLWRHYTAILKMVTVIVYPRLGSCLQNAPKSIQEVVRIIKTPRIEISSSMIRRLLRENRRISYLVPRAVDELIAQNISSYEGTRG